MPLSTNSKHTGIQGHCFDSSLPPVEQLYRRHPCPCALALSHNRHTPQPPPLRTSPRERHRRIRAGRRRSQQRGRRRCLRVHFPVLSAVRCGRDDSRICAGALRKRSNIGDPGRARQVRGGVSECWWVPLVRASRGGVLLLAREQSGWTGGKDEHFRVTSGETGINPTQDRHERSPPKRRGDRWRQQRAKSAL